VLKFKPWGCLSRKIPVIIGLIKHLTYAITPYAFWAILGLLFTSCDRDMTLEIVNLDSDQPKTYIFDVSNLSGGVKSTSDSLKPYVLGPERDNPYTVAKLNEAAQSIGVTSSYSTSDLYVKFTPQDDEDMIELDEADLFLLDFPWTREIIEKGDYYQTSDNKDEFPELYTTFSVGDPIPDVPYEIIANLDLTVTDYDVIEEAFGITGNSKDFEETFGTKKDCICLQNPRYDEGGDLVCEGDCDDTGGGGGGIFITNDCGCEIFRDERKPGGTIKVFDTQFQRFEGVKRVRVVAKNGWFSWRTTETDDNGCWRVNRQFKGKAWFWVKFKDKVSDRGRIRFAGVRGWRLWQKGFTGSFYVGRLAGPNFHDIQVNFNAWDGNTVGTKVHYAWAGATVNNALHEYHDYAAQEGFVIPPKLDIMVPLGRRDGFTIMLRHMGTNNFINAFSDGNAIAGGGGNSLSTAGLGILINAITGTLALSNTIGRVSVRKFLGDVNIGGNKVDSDDLKHLAYHEIGHASHYEATSNSFWKDVIRAEVAARGHGDEDSHNAGIIQIAESWAEHISLTMVKQQYPLPVADPSRNTVAFQDWSIFHERVRNESFGHIPIGLFNDLIDGVNNTESVIEEDFMGFFSLNDPVLGGYTNSFFAQQMNSSVTSPAGFRQRCLSNLPSGVTPFAINTLFEEY